MFFLLRSFCLDTKRTKKIKSQNAARPQCRATPAFGSGQRAGKEFSFATEKLSMICWRSHGLTY